MSCLTGCFRCCCGVGCAICWIFIGIWAFFFLGVLGILFLTGHKGNVGHFNPEDDKKNGTTIMITWAIYTALTIFCSGNLWYRLKHPFPVADPNEGKEQFSAIGPASGNTPMGE